MSALLLRLAGPMQAWGDSSRWTTRKTSHRPTKSAIVGLLAAAQGRRRSESIADLVSLKFAVRVDQPGTLMRDFQTAIRSTRGKTTSMPLSHRYYLADSVFVVGVEGPSSLLEGLNEALLTPVFPLYLGRRSCPHMGKLLLGLMEEPMLGALRSEQWHAAAWFQNRYRKESYHASIFRDALDVDEIGEPVRDIPLSFAEERREYEWRTVVEDEPVRFGGSDRTDEPAPVVSGLSHDPMNGLGG